MQKRLEQLQQDYEKVINNINNLNINKFRLEGAISILQELLQTQSNPPTNQDNNKDISV